VNEWNDAKAGRMAFYVIAGLGIGLALMLGLVLAYAATQPGGF
jgi:hypothetical protein